MGNKLISGYSISRDPLPTWSPFHGWTLNSAHSTPVTTDNTQSSKLVTIFSFEKKNILEKKFSKEDREDALAVLRRDVHCLQKLKHPNILELIEPLQEDTKTLAFTVMAITCTLGTILRTGIGWDRGGQYLSGLWGIGDPKYVFLGYSHSTTPNGKEIANAPRDIDESEVNLSSLYPLITFQSGGTSQNMRYECQGNSACHRSSLGYVSTKIPATPVEKPVISSSSKFNIFGSATATGLISKSTSLFPTKGQRDLNLGSKRIEHGVPPDSIPLDFIAYLTEVQTGIHSIASALQYAHDLYRVVHLNVNPDSIYIGACGRWYLGNFGFARPVDIDIAHPDTPTKSGLTPIGPLQRSTTLITAAFGGSYPLHLNPEIPLALAPNMRYSAPEILRGSPPRTAADVFSLGLVIYECFTLQPLIPIHIQNASAVLAEFESLKQKGTVVLPMHMPQYITDTINACVFAEATQRPEVKRLLCTEFFSDTYTRTLVLLDNYDQHDAAQQQRFLLSVPKLLVEDLDGPINQPMNICNRLLPILSRYIFCQKFAAEALESIFTCFEVVEYKLNKQWISCPENSRDILSPSVAFFRTRIWPAIKPMLTSSAVELAPVIVLCKNLVVLYKNLSNQERLFSLNRFLLRCLDMNDPEISKSILPRTDEILDKFIDIGSIIDPILPALVNHGCIAVHDDVKSAVLDSLAIIHTRLPRDLVSDAILPKLQAIFPTRNLNELKTSPAFDCVAKIFKSQINGSDTVCLSQRVLPHLVSWIASNSINKLEFECIVNLFEGGWARLMEQRKEMFTERAFNDHKLGLALGYTTGLQQLALTNENTKLPAAVTNAIPTFKTSFANTVETSSQKPIVQTVVEPKEELNLFTLSNTNNSNCFSLDSLF